MLAHLRGDAFQAPPVHTKKQKSSKANDTSTIRKKAEALEVEDTCQGAPCFACFESSYISVRTSSKTTKNCSRRGKEDVCVHLCKDGKVLRSNTVLYLSASS